MDRRRSPSAHGPATQPGPSRGADPTPPRPHTDRHGELVETLATTAETEQDAGRRWATVALHACLAHLLTSDVTEARRVSIIDAWVDDEDGLCLVYVPPFDERRIVGLRRTRTDVSFPDYWRLGDRTGWGYELGTGDDPIPFGWNVADFDLGEPLGYVTTILRHDAADVGWWGDLDETLPRPPAHDD